MGKDYKLVNDEIIEVGVDKLKFSALEIFEEGIEQTMSRARDWDFGFKHLIGGLTFYPYQIAVGISIRYWPCIFAPSIRIHIGPFKVWCCWIFKGREL